MKLKNKKLLSALVVGSVLLGSVATVVAVSCSKDENMNLEFNSQSKLTKDNEGFYYASFKTKAPKQSVEQANFSASIDSTKEVVVSKAKNIKEENGYISFDLKLPKLSSENDVKIIVVAASAKFNKYNFTLTKNQLNVQSDNKESDSQETKPTEETKNPETVDNSESNKDQTNPNEETKPSTDTTNKDQEDNKTPETNPVENNPQNPDGSQTNTNAPEQPTSETNTNPEQNQPNTESTKPTTSSNGSSNNVQLSQVSFTQQVQNDPMISFDFYTNIQIDYSTLDTVKIILEDNSLVDTVTSQNHGSNQYSGTATLPTTNTTVKIKGIKFTYNNVENTYMLSEADSKTFTVKANQ